MSRTFTTTVSGILFVVALLSLTGCESSSDSKPSVAPSVQTDKTEADSGAPYLLCNPKTKRYGSFEYQRKPGFINDLTVCERAEKTRHERKIQQIKQGTLRLLANETSQTDKLFRLIDAACDRHYLQDERAANHPPGSGSWFFFTGSPDDAILKMYSRLYQENSFDSQVVAFPKSFYVALLQACPNRVKGRL